MDEHVADPASAEAEASALTTQPLPSSSIPISTEAAHQPLLNRGVSLVRRGLAHGMRTPQAMARARWNKVKHAVESIIR